MKTFKYQATITNCFLNNSVMIIELSRVNFVYEAAKKYQKTVDYNRLETVKTGYKTVI